MATVAKTAGASWLRICSIAVASQRKLLFSTYLSYACLPKWLESSTDVSICRGLWFLPFHIAPYGLVYVSCTGLPHNAVCQGLVSTLLTQSDCPISRKTALQLGKRQPTPRLFYWCTWFVFTAGNKFTCRHYWIVVNLIGPRSSKCFVGQILL